jgi:hypothetical protein
MPELPLPMAELGFQMAELGFQMSEFSFEGPPSPTRFNVGVLQPGIRFL